MDLYCQSEMLCGACGIRRGIHFPAELIPHAMTGRDGGRFLPLDFPRARTDPEFVSRGNISKVTFALSKYYLLRTKRRYRRIKVEICECKIEPLNPPIAGNGP